MLNWKGNIGALLQPLIAVCIGLLGGAIACLLYTSPSPRD